MRPESLEEKRAAMMSTTRRSISQEAEEAEEEVEALLFAAHGLAEDHGIARASAGLHGDAHLRHGEAAVQPRHGSRCRAQPALDARTRCAARPALYRHIEAGSAFLEGEVLLLVDLLNDRGRLGGPSDV